MYRVYPKKTIVILALALSLLVELAQYCIHVGLCEVDDVISNTFGGYIGYLIAKCSLNIQNKTEKIKEATLS